MGFGGSDCAVKVMLLLNRRPPADSVSKLVVFGAPPVGGVKPRARPARRSSKSPARHPDFYIRHILVRRAVVRKHERGEVSRKLRQHHIDPLPPSYQGFFVFDTYYVGGRSPAGSKMVHTPLQRIPTIRFGWV